MDLTSIKGHDITEVIAHAPLVWALSMRLVAVQISECLNLYKTMAIS